MKLFPLITLLITFNVQAICVHEKTVLGLNMTSLGEQYQVFVKQADESFSPLSNFTVNPVLNYTVQLLEKRYPLLGDFGSYNKKYIEYYEYGHLEKFLKNTNALFSKLGYETVVVGKSIEGRNLYSIRPTAKDFDLSKKTIVMFGRHHGDEGTANWIIEGFVADFLQANEAFHDEYQLILYPMVNPDGAMAQTRYNKNRRDLNRSWSTDMGQTYDEAKTIHKDLKQYLSKSKQVVIALDVHGSFTEDFIYRVDESFIDRDFFSLQQRFIDALGSRDQWQVGNFKRSNGHPKMARIVLVKNYSLNALTHETPRDIKLRNRKNRSKASLIAQGSAMFDSILD